MNRLYWGALAGQWRAGLVLLGCSVLEGLPAFLSGWLVARAVDRGFHIGDPMAGLGWLGLFGLASVAGALGSRLVWRWLGSVVEPLRDILVSAVVRGVLRDPDPPRNTPDASGVARITQHVEIVRDATGGLLVQARGMIVTVAAALAGTFGVAGELGWVASVPVAAAIVLFAALLPSLARRQRVVTLAEEHAAAAAGTVLAGIRDVVACGAEPVAAAAVHHAVDAQAHAARRLARATAARSAVIGIGAFAPIIGSLALAPGLVASGRLTAGDALGALVYLATTMEPALRGLSATTSTVILRLLVALRRLAETAEIPDEIDGDAQPTDATISARGLTFGWGAAAEPVVHHLNLDLTPGEVLAVVGPSGIGKSTLASLLTGLLTPREGQVLLGGAPLRSIRASVRRATVALIPQQAYVFGGTVRENLALLAPNTSDNHLLAAADAVGAGELITRLGGLSSELRAGATGVTLSAGEAQLLALARVYASPATVIVLDEATSHLDPTAEAHAETAFAERGGVLIVVAHRLSSALRADRVLLMDGTQTHLGTHHDLLTNSPRYAAMMTAWTVPTPT